MSDPPAPSAGLDHVTVTVTDLARGMRFYDAALGALGYARRHEWLDEEEGDAAETEAVAYGRPDAAPVLWLVTGDRPTTGLHLAFRVGERAAIDRFHGAAVDAGGVSRSSPRRWPIFRTGEFNAIVADPDGNLVEVVGPE